MRVLVIDDDPRVRENLRDVLEEAGGWHVIEQGFDNVVGALETNRPDFVVLDLIEGSGADGADSGNASFKRIWETWFCPVIVYSAFPDQQRFGPHPLVKCVRKGSGSDDLVRDRLTVLRPQAEMIAEVHAEFDTHIREALRDSTVQLSEQLESQSNGVRSLARSVRRLVAARIDEGAYDEEPLHAWERFVVPPLGEHPLTADLLHRAGAEWNDPGAFRLVLTPSCDLVRRGDKRARADRILVASCEPVRQLDTLKSGKRSRKLQKLRSQLNDGAIGPHLPIPRLQGQVPSMVANLKRLELLDWAQIVLDDDVRESQTEQPRYRRIASTDSPFREMITWSYLRIAGRPGLPDVNADAWATEIVDGGIIETP